MDSNFISQISWHEIIDLISDSRKQIRLVLPSIHSEWVILLEEAHKRGVDIKVCLNNTEKIIREGFGDDNAVKKLLDLNIPVNELRPNRISLISVDHNHFLYFPSSRIFEDPTDQGILNASSLDKVTAISILASFFPEDLSALRNELVDNSIFINEIYNDRLVNIADDLSLGRINSQAKVLNQKKFDEIRNELKKNPPIEPDLKRAIEVYNLKVQFAELRFENGKITGKRVRIPKNALPFESPELKRIIDAGMKIFEDGNKNNRFAFEIYSSIQDDVKKLRETYLIPIKCRPEKSILIKIKKTDFQNDIDAINNRIQAEKLKLINDIDSEIDKAKDRLGNELERFFLKNPPGEIKGYYSEEREPSKIKDYVHDILRKMNFPQAHEMVEGMKLITHFYDLTWNDFSDRELIKEFGAKGILKEDLESIRELSNAFEARK